MFPKFEKDPDAVMDYEIDWSLWLGTDTIVASTWTIDDGITEHASTTFDTTSTTLWLSGGTVGTTYNAINHITTQSGREEDQTIRIRLKQK